MSVALAPSVMVAGATKLALPGGLVSATVGGVLAATETFTTADVALRAPRLSVATTVNW